MDASRDHVHQLSRRPVPADAQELDSTIDHLEFDISHWIARSVAQRQDRRARDRLLHGHYHLRGYTRSVKSSLYNLARDRYNYSLPRFIEIISYYGQERRYRYS